MTPQNLIKLDFNEVSGIEVTCLTCKITTAVLPVPRDGYPPVSFDCPGCQKRLWGDDGDEAFTVLLAMTQAISAWKRFPQKRFTLGFSVAAK